MKSIAIIVALCVLSVVASKVSTHGEDKVLLTEEFVNKLNTHPTKKWTASTEQGAFFKGATTRQVRGLMGFKPKASSRLAPKKTYSTELLATLPAEFDSMSKWPACKTIDLIRDQSACGSCWANAAAEAISDRYCTMAGKQVNISAAHLMSCCYTCGNGCNGGDDDSAWSYWVSNGLVTEECYPYPFPKCEHHIPVNHYPACPKNEYPTPSCPTTCKNGAPWTPMQGSRSWSLSGENSYMVEIWSNGPIEVGFNVYADFPTYKGGVYHHVSSDYLGGHAVKITGWGTLNGTKYWKVANSWNSDWGLNGFFLIERGNDECGIEDDGSAGSP